MNFRCSRHGCRDLLLDFTLLLHFGCELSLLLLLKSHCGHTIDPEECCLLLEMPKLLQAGFGKVPLPCLFELSLSALARIWGVAESKTLGFSLQVIFEIGWAKRLVPLPIDYSVPYLTLAKTSNPCRNYACSQMRLASEQ